MKETELAEKFIDYYNDEKHEVFKEVPCNGIVDIVVKSGHITQSIEVKTNLNFEVIRQAEKNQMWFNYSYIAVPAPKHSKHFGYSICNRFGIGVLVATSYGEIKEVVKPRLNRKVRFKPALLPYMKESVAGSQNQRITAFSNTIQEMVLYIKRHPGCSLNQCLENVNFHWSTTSSAKSCVYQWIKKGVIKEFYIKDKKLFLS